MTKKLLLLIPLLAPYVCVAQSDASVLGTVTDATGSVAPGAKLRLDNLRTGVSESAESDGNGIYQFLNVPVGQYRVTAQATGFKTVTTEEFTVAVEARQRVDIRLAVGDATETVTVNDAAAALETDSTNRGQVVQHDNIVNL